MYLEQWRLNSVWWAATIFYKELMSRTPHKQHTQCARLSHVCTPGDMSSFSVLNNYMFCPYPGEVCVLCMITISCAQACATHEEHVL